MRQRLIGRQRCSQRLLARMGHPAVEIVAYIFARPAYCMRMRAAANTSSASVNVCWRCVKVNASRSDPARRTIVAIQTFHQMVQPLIAMIDTCAAARSNRIQSTLHEWEHIYVRS
jgi:hypothetical protein